MLYDEVFYKILYPKKFWFLIYAEIMRALLLNHIEFKIIQKSENSIFTK